MKINIYNILLIVLLSSKINAQYQFIGDNEQRILDFAKSTNSKIEKINQNQNNPFLLMTTSSHTAAFYFNNNTCNAVAIFPESDDYLFYYIYDFNHSKEFKKISDELWTCVVRTKIIGIRYITSGNLKYFICEEI
jgi:hypothetical protein